MQRKLLPHRPGEHHHGHAQGRTTTYTQHARARQGVVEDRLHEQSRRCQARTGRCCRDHLGQAHLRDDDPVRTGQFSGKREPYLGQGDIHTAHGQAHREQHQGNGQEQ